MRDASAIAADLEMLIAILQPIKTKLSDLFNELTSDQKLSDEAWEWLERLEARKEWKVLESWDRLKDWEGLENWKEVSQGAPPLVAWHLSGLIATIEDHLSAFEIEFRDTSRVAKLERCFPAERKP